MEKFGFYSVNGDLQAKALKLPEAVWDAKGLEVMGRRIRGIIYSTDIATIRNCNADAVLAVYPFPPQQTISKAIIEAAAMPVFCGVGGGLTNGMKSAVASMEAASQGAYGVVTNVPMDNDTIKEIRSMVDIPIVSTVVDERMNIRARIAAGTTIINVAAGARTAEVVRKIRKQFSYLPIMATGGNTDESIRETIAAGANAIVYTPPCNTELIRQIMVTYREGNLNIKQI